MKKLLCLLVSLALLMSLGSFVVSADEPWTCPVFEEIGLIVTISHAPEIVTFPDPRGSRDRVTVHILEQGAVVTVDNGQNVRVGWNLNATTSSALTWSGTQGGEIVSVESASAFGVSASATLGRPAIWSTGTGPGLPWTFGPVNVQVEDLTRNAQGNPDFMVLGVLFAGLGDSRYDSETLIFVLRASDNDIEEPTDDNGNIAIVPPIGELPPHDGVNVRLDGNYLYFNDVPPQIIENRTMVPLRVIFEALGAEIDWNGDTQTVTATRGDTVVVMQVGNRVITVDETEVTLDVPPMIIDNRTLVPARAVAESFGVDVDWDVDTQTVVLTTD